MESRKGNACATLDFCLTAAKDKSRGVGEDAFVFSLSDGADMVGVFDGLGGSGARRYSVFRGHTGAYIASRTAAAACLDWFSNCYPSVPGDAAGLKRVIDRYTQLLQQYEDAEGPSAIRAAGIIKKFPTTAAVAVCSPSKTGVKCEFYWAGDSRGYILRPQGLEQITRDDASEEDIRTQIDGDPPMNNVISLGGWKLNSAARDETGPMLVLTATDGCYKYWRSPMDFEYQLLDALENSETVRDWERQLYERLGRVASDDFSLTGLCYGSGSFAALKEAFYDRREALWREYIEPMNSMDREQILDLWEKYSRDYIKYC